MEIKVGDKYKGKINGAIFEITKINEKTGVIHFICNGEEDTYSLTAFKHCLLEKIN